MTNSLPMPTWPKHKISTAGLRRYQAEQRLAKALKKKTAEAKRK